MLLEPKCTVSRLAIRPWWCDGILALPHGSRRLLMALDYARYNESGRRSRSLKRSDL